MTRIFERAGVTAGTEVVMRSNQYFYSLDNMLRNESDNRDRYLFTSMASSPFELQQVHYIALAELKGGGAPLPYGSKLFYFCAVFQKSL